VAHHNTLGANVKAKGTQRDTVVKDSNRPADILGGIERELIDLEADLNGHWGAFEILRGSKEGTYIDYSADSVVNLESWR